MPAFPQISKIQYEGPESKNPLAFRCYNPDEQVEGKSMKDHLRFSVAYWHTMRGTGSDPFGPGTMIRPWEAGGDTVENAKNRARMAFEFMEKLGSPFFCFHDRDVAPEGKSLAESNKNLDAVVAVIKEEMQRTGIKLLWGTANLFSNPRYAHGASTSCNADAFAFAAAQVKKALEVTKELGGDGYVFWGGREGYQTLWNTDMKRELDHMARFMHMAVDYAKKIGFTGQFYIEPKPKEPTKHQYDFDAAACINFLRAYDLAPHFKLNIETNHATLAGHTVEHELEYAAHQGFLGSVDANTGDLLLGWDTDQFPTDVYLAAKIMLAFLKVGGFKTGGVNFDAKVRRESFEPVDLFYAHIGGMDTFAKGLKIAAANQGNFEPSPLQQRKLIRVFVSCAHENADLVDDFLARLFQQLAPSKRYDYQLWRDRAIPVGALWRKEIREALDRCDIGLLLLSPAFLVSNFITQHELPKFVGDDATPVIPVMLETVDIIRHDLRGIQAHQIFWPNERSYADCTSVRSKRKSVELLFRQIEYRLDEARACPGFSREQRDSVWHGLPACQNW